MSPNIFGVHIKLNWLGIPFEMATLGNTVIIKQVRKGTGGVVV
jgi:hypothetical protein